MNLDDDTSTARCDGPTAASASSTSFPAMTLAWLGPAADESDLALQELRDGHFPIPARLRALSRPTLRPEAQRQRPMATC